MKNKHLLSCSKLNNGKPTNLKYEQILNGNMEEKIEILRKIQENSKKREENLNQTK